jgi:hypothetical protein
VSLLLMEIQTIKFYKKLKKENSVVKVKIYYYQSVPEFDGITNAAKDLIK